jgi:hypothetical protein
MIWARNSNGGLHEVRQFLFRDGDLRLRPLCLMLGVSPADKSLPDNPEAQTAVS